MGLQPRLDAEEFTRFKQYRIHYDGGDTEGSDVHQQKQAKVQAQAQQHDPPPQAFHPDEQGECGFEDEGPPRAESEKPGVGGKPDSQPCAAKLRVHQMVGEGCACPPVRGGRNLPPTRHSVQITQVEHYIESGHWRAFPLARGVIGREDQGGAMPGKTPIIGLEIHSLLENKCARGDEKDQGAKPSEAALGDCDPSEYEECEEGVCGGRGKDDVAREPHHPGDSQGTLIGIQLWDVKRPAIPGEKRHDDEQESRPLPAIGGLVGKALESGETLPHQNTTPPGSGAGFEHSHTSSGVLLALAGGVG